MTILNHYGPRSEDAWLASLLMQALKDLLPGMFGAELGFLVPLGCSGGCSVGSPTKKASVGNVSPIVHRGFRYKHVKKIQIHHVGGCLVRKLLGSQCCEKDLRFTTHCMWKLAFGRREMITVAIRTPRMAMAYSEIRAATCPDKISIMSTHLGKRCKVCPPNVSQ